MNNVEFKILQSIFGIGSEDLDHFEKALDNFNNHNQDLLLDLIYDYIEDLNLNLKGLDLNGILYLIISNTVNSIGDLDIDVYCNYMCSELIINQDVITRDSITNLMQDFDQDSLEYEALEFCLKSID